MSETSRMTIIEFLEARIAEDEERAGSGWARLGDSRWETTNEGQDFLTPSAVLAECAAKRAIISGTYWEHKERPSDAELHRSAAHPDYEYETTEGQRKRWDEADEPPDGEGWERNTGRGFDGWARFEYTEESYWRRLKPEADRKEWQQYIPNDLRALASVYKDHPDYQQEWSV